MPMTSATRLPVKDVPAGPGLGMAFACIGSAAILLVLALRRPAETLCDPVVGLPIVAFAVAQAIFIIGVGFLRRQGVSQLFAAAIPLAWSMMAGAVLVMRQCAGDVAAIGQGDAVFAGASVLGLFLMFHGMAMKLEKSALAGFLVVAALALVISLGWIKLMDGGPVQRTWNSWEAVNRVNDALVAFKAKTGKVPPSGESLDDAMLKIDQVLGGSVPRIDGWGRELEYVSDGKTYEIASRGAFGELGPVSTGAVRAFADDIVIANGVVVSWPESPCVSAEEAAAQADAKAAVEATKPKELPVPPGAIDKRHQRRRR
jgi:hypothetical protein